MEGKGDSFIYFLCLLAHDKAISNVRPFLIHTLLRQHPGETAQTLQLFGFISMSDRHQMIAKGGEQRAAPPLPRWKSSLQGSGGLRAPFPKCSCCSS